MNNFDFSQYDYGDENQPTQQPKSGFNFSDYEIDEPVQVKTNEAMSKDKLYQLQKAPEVSRDELKNMTARQKYEYAQDLKREREYLTSAGFTKGALSGATLGASEYVDALKPQEYESGQTVGNLVGSALPITGAAKAVGIPLKYATQNLPKVLSPVVKLMHAFGTGAGYETGKQGVKAVAGDETDLSQIPVTGLEFATIDSILRGGSALAKRFRGISPANQSQILEQGIIPADLPKSQYETAEEMLKLIQQQRPNTPFREFPDVPSPPSGRLGGVTLNPQRVTQRESSNFRPTPPQTQSQNPNLRNRVGNITSPNRFYNPGQAGQALKDEVINIDEDVYRGVNELYNVSREMNSGINEIHPQLVNRLQARVRELETIPSPSSVQTNLINRSNQILDTLRTAGPNGEVTGYRPVNNQTLIDQVQSLRQVIDFDYAHGDANNIFRPVINDLQDAAIRAAENSSTPEAAGALQEARNAYRTWVQAFDNPFVKKFRNITKEEFNPDYNALFKSSEGLDQITTLRNILDISPRGQELTNGLTREVVDSKLAKYFDNPRKINQAEFDKDLRELEYVLTPEQSTAIREEFRDATRQRAKKAPPREPTNDEKIASRYEKNTPEDIQKLMDSRSGIKQLRKDFSDTKVKKEVFERLSKQKLRSILREGNIEKDFTGDDLYRFLNKEKNYELFSEILGETETESLRSTAKEIGKQEVKKEAKKKGVSKALNKLAAYKTIETILSLL